MNKYNKLLIGVCIIVMQFLICSCDPVYDFNTSIYVDNKTDKEFLVYAKSYLDSAMLSINANKNEILVKKFRGGLVRDGEYHHDRYDIYIYIA
jgi:hypothetical protein